MEAEYVAEYFGRNIFVYDLDQIDLSNRDRAKRTGSVTLPKGGPGNPSPLIFQTLRYVCTTVRVDYNTRKETS